MKVITIDINVKYRVQFWTDQAHKVGHYGGNVGLPCDDNIVPVDIQPKTLVFRSLKILVQVGENIGAEKQCCEDMKQLLREDEEATADSHPWLYLYLYFIGICVCICICVFIWISICICVCIYIRGR